MIHPLPESDMIESSVQSALSPLYEACRQNDVHSVTEILSNISNEQLNQIEPNGSTALHVASYYDHDNIVHLLLEKGVSITIKNKYGLTVVEEARTDETRKLFEKRVNHDDQDRFVGNVDSFEWLTVNERAAEYAAFYQAALKKAYEKGLDQNKLLHYLMEIYVKNPKGMYEVFTCINLFFKTKDHNLIVKAYTVESDFYRTLNIDLAKTIKYQDQFDTEFELKYKAAGAIAALLSYSPTFEALSFKGETYRGMLITRKDLDQYKPGSIIMIKSFLSTSKELSVAEKFAKKEAMRQAADGKLIQVPVICHYIIRNTRSALAIETISIYKKEREVIILPINVFKVVSVKEKNGQFEIKLVEQDRLVTLSMIGSDSRASSVFGVMCYYAFPCCYRMCCLRCCGVVEFPES
jgi:hypothetical protein